jgi:hypothetical protein
MSNGLAGDKCTHAQIPATCFIVPFLHFKVIVTTCAAGKTKVRYSNKLEILNMELL